MDLTELVRALLSYDTLAARAWVVDANRNGIDWEHLVFPAGLDAVALAVAAGIVEVLAARCGQQPPAWAHAVPPSPRRVFLIRAAETMPRLRRTCELEGPEPLVRRGVLATPDFLTFA